MIGNLEILRLRDEAKARLGDRFDIREFHDQVLGCGTVTLPLLRDLIEESQLPAKRARKSPRRPP
jgi:uncharacterized protein (DUF885 family)